MLLKFEVAGTVKESIGFLWRIRMGSPAAARRLGEALGPLYAGRALPARPTIVVNGSVVEVARGFAVPIQLAPAVPVAAGTSSR